MNSQSLFTDLERSRIQLAILEAEKKTSGEIRIHLESICSSSAFERATELFSILNMHNTRDRNGVLIYLAYESRVFAVIADKGINEKVPEGFWNSIVDDMSVFFKSAQFADGLIHGILKCGEKLAVYFPYNASDDLNELSNDISFGQ
ncbi:MAG: TPM domain-containing protein [Bacteroidetes bacterium]|nr:TPM domain-containing protein [Bacteroidota bacterium]